MHADISQSKRARLLFPELVTKTLLVSASLCAFQRLRRLAADGLTRATRSHVRCLSTEAHAQDRSQQAVRHPHD